MLVKLNIRVVVDVNFRVLVELNFRVLMFDGVSPLYHAFTKILQKSARVTTLPGFCDTVHASRFLAVQIPSCPMAGSGA